MMSEQFRDVDGKSLDQNIWSAFWVMYQYTHRNISRDQAVAKIVSLGFSHENATEMIDETMQDDSP